MKRPAKFALFAGLALLCIVVAHEGAHGIAILLTRTGWWLLLLAPLHALPLLPDALGWRALIIGVSQVRQLFWIAAIRQAVSRLLPVASIGGELVGIRLLRRTGVPGRFTAASVIVEVLVTLIAEYLFAMLGIVCLLQIIGVVHIVQALSVGLVATLPVIVLVVLVVHRGSLFERLERIAMQLFRRKVTEKSHAGADVDAAIREVCGSTPRLMRALVCQWLNLAAGCFETWAALRLLGTSVSIAEAVVLESLTSAARHIMFMVPAALGVQELSFIAVGQLLGIGSDISVALSLAKRIGEILFGLPALLSWQWIESREYFTKSLTDRK